MYSKQLQCVCSLQYPHSEKSHDSGLFLNTPCVEGRVGTFPSLPLSLYPSIFLSLYLSIPLSLSPSISLSLYLSLPLSLYPSISLSLYLSLPLSLSPSISLSLYLSVPLFLYLSLPLSLYPSLLSLSSSLSTSSRTRRYVPGSRRHHRSATDTCVYRHGNTRDESG